MLEIKGRCLTGVLHWNTSTPVNYTIGFTTFSFWPAELTTHCDWVGWRYWYPQSTTGKHQVWLKPVSLAVISLILDVSALAAFGQSLNMTLLSSKLHTTWCQLTGSVMFQSCSKINDSNRLVITWLQFLTVLCEPLKNKGWKGACVMFLQQHCVPLSLWAVRCWATPSQEEPSNQMERGGGGGASITRLV